FVVILDLCVGESRSFWQKDRTRLGRRLQEGGDARLRQKAMPFAADGKVPARIETEGQGFFQSEIAADDGEEPPRLPRPVPPLASAPVAFEEGPLSVPSICQDEADWLKRGRKGLRRGLGGVGEHRFL